MDTALAPEPAQPLRQALRRARSQAAERSQAATDLRIGERVRLELLREALLPVFRELPADVDLFDLALVPGEPPRLFVDLVAFVDIARDQRTYRLLRDTRTGRQVLAEDADVEAMVEHVTDYVAHRLVEREQALAAILRPSPGGTAKPPSIVGVDDLPAQEHPPGARLAAGLAFVLGVLIGIGAGLALS